VADAKISALTAATVAAAANEFAINEAGVSKKLTASLLRDLIGAQTAVLGTDHTVASTTATEVTGLSMTLVAGTYHFSYFLIVQSTNAANAPWFGVNYTGTITRMVAMYKWASQGSGTASTTMEDELNTAAGAVYSYSVTRAASTSSPNLTGTSLTAAVDADIFAIVEGIIVVSDGGDLELWHASDAAITTSVESGSNLVVTRVA
jgi:hypothetical protein